VSRPDAGDGSPPVAQGLCGACSWARHIRNRRGSTFLLCGMSKRDPDFPRYPRLPILECRGFRQAGDPAGPNLNDSRE